MYSQEREQLDNPPRHYTYFHLALRHKVSILQQEAKKKGEKITLETLGVKLKVGKQVKRFDVVNTQPEPAQEAHSLAAICAAWEFHQVGKPGFRP